MNLGFVGGGPSTAEWTAYTGIPNSADKDADVALTKQDTLMTFGGAGSIRGTVAISTGKVFFLTYIYTFGANFFTFGFMKATASLADYVGQDANGYGRAFDGVYNGATKITSYGSSPADGDMVMAAIDIPNLKIYFGRNNAWEPGENPLTNTGGTSISAGTYYPAWGVNSANPIAITCKGYPPNTVLFQ